MNLKNQEVILDILNIAIDAGKEILKIYKKNFKVDLKADNSPITEADINSNNLIKKRLIEIEKNIPILTEESLVNWETRRVWKKYWLIDPLDGTKEFVNRNGEFTVNISLIENNLPIFGVIYAPEKSLLYYGIKNNGSYKLITQDNINTLSEFKKININNNTTSNIKIIGSRSHSNKDFQIWIEKNFSQYEVISIGSSLKLCLLAEGTADIYPRLGPTSEWDIAAGHIILEEAGGKLKSFDNTDILYNTKENIINPNFLAYGNVFKLN